MSNEQPALARRLAELRRSFDGAFAEKTRDRVVDDRNFLGVGLGADRYVVRLEDIRGLFADKTIVPLTGRLPELLGITGIRGSVVPVFSLGRLLGCPAPKSSPRWLFVGGRSALGFAFDEFDGYLCAPLSAVVAAEGESLRDLAREALVVANTTRPIVSIEPLIESIGKRAGVPDARKEH